MYFHPLFKIVTAIPIWKNKENFIACLPDFSLRCFSSLFLKWADLWGDFKGVVLESLYFLTDGSINQVINIIIVQKTNLNHFDYIAKVMLNVLFKYWLVFFIWFYQVKITVSAFLLDLLQNKWNASVNF